MKRNLSAGEILAQALYVARDRKDVGGVNKLVMMGSGEPLANYENTIKFIRLLNAPYGLNIGMRSISVARRYRRKAQKDNARRGTVFGRAFDFRNARVL